MVILGKVGRSDLIAADESREPRKALLTGPSHSHQHGIAPWQGDYARDAHNMLHCLMKHVCGKPYATQTMHEDIYLYPAEGQALGGLAAAGRM
jgi:hypothetical protein